jgi:unsaturated rhamnogalacturonyl hydrolase
MFRKLLFLLCFVVIGSNAQKMPKKADVLEVMALTNEYFMNKWPDVGKTIVTNRERVSNIWTRAVYYEGLMELYKIDPKEEYLDYMVDWAEYHKWNLRRGNTFTRNADNQCAGQIYIDLYNMDPDPERVKYIKMSIDSMMNTSKIDDWDWIDAIQMAMPVFAQLGKLYNDNAYYERMYEMYICSKDSIGGGLYNYEDRLWWRDPSFKPPHLAPNGEDVYWSRGNGWVVAALVRVLDIIPQDEPHREEYLKTLFDMLEALKKVQREDGFWNVSLHDPDHFGGKESTGTSLFIYGMAWGINNGYLKKKDYQEAILKAWNALVNEAVHQNGFLGYVQGTGSGPADGQPVGYDQIPDFEDYGLGCFLLAASEVYKMAK